MPATHNGIAKRIRLMEKEKAMFARGLLVGLLLLTTKCLWAASPGVVINELFYHAPDEIPNLEFIELFNPTPEAVDVSGWKLSKSVQFQFAPGTKIAAEGYLV